MKYRIVKIHTVKDHMKHDHREIIGVYKSGAREVMFYYDKTLALNQAGILNCAEKDYDISWEIEEIK